MEEEADTYLCPGCDREVRVGSRGCPNCTLAGRRPRRKERPKAAAKRARKSWEQGSSYEGLDLPEDDFNYDDFVAREFGEKPFRKIGIKWYWWVTAVVLLALMVLGSMAVLR